MKLTGAERTLCDLRGQDERLAAVAALRGAKSATTTLENRRNRFRISLPESPRGTTAAIAVRHRDVGVRKELLAKLTPGNVYDLAVSGRDLALGGVWQVEVRLRQDSVVVDLPVVLPHPHSAWPVSRWHRTVTSPVVRAGNQLVLVRRPGLPARLFRKATAVLARRARWLLGR